MLVASTELTSQWRTSQVAAASISLVASLVCLSLSQFEHFRSIRPSVLLQLYLMIACVVEAVHLRTVWLRSSSVMLRAMCCGQLISCAAFLASESMAKESILLTKTKRSPQDVNDIFSQRLFLWLNGLFQKGYRQVLAPQDLYIIDEDLASDTSQRKFRLTWLVQTRKNRDTKLYWILLLSLKKYFLFPAIPRALLIAVNFGQPYFIKRLVAFVDDPSAAEPNEGPLLALAAFLIYTFIATFQAWYYQSCSRFETKLRGTLITSIHDKALRSRPDAQSSPLMLMNVDVEKASNGLRMQHEYWASILSMAVALYLLERQVGLSFLAPTILMILMLVVILKNGAKIAPKQKIWLGATQKRVTFITKVIAAMKNIKLMGLVSAIQEIGTKLREEEVNAQRAIRKSMMLNIMFSLTTFQLCSLVLYSAYAIQVYLGGPPLSNANLFSSMAILKLFTTPLLEAIQFFPNVLQGLAALSRIQKYLLIGDHQDRRREMQASGYPLQNDPDTKVAVVENAVVGYTGSPSILKGMNATIYTGKLHIVTGIVGSGKSTLLKTLIGETDISSGSVQLSMFDTSFCDQQPWLWNGTIKQNILGEAELEQIWFDRVIWACGLDDDFSQIPEGANAKAGDDGTSLSGGQKNRISLARALYSRKRFMVADDILSGLDTRTEALVFGRVFGPNGVLKQLGTTVVLGTHSVGWLQYADQVIIVDAGKSAYQGSPMTIPSRFDSLISHSSSFQEEDHSASQKKDQVNAVVDEMVKDAKVEADSALQYKGIYMDYLRSFGLGTILSWMAFGAVPYVSRAMETIILQWWAGKNTTNHHDLALYTGTLLGVTLIDFCSLLMYLWYYLIILAPKSSLTLHAMQWKALVEVKFSHWNNVDNGGVANRFSQDMSLVDMILLNSFMNVSAVGMMLLTGIAVIFVATPITAASLPFIAGVLYIIQKVYLKTSKQLRVMDLEAKTPLCAHFLETASGVTTINAYGWTEKNAAKNKDLLYKSQVPYYLMLSIQQWLALVLNLVVAGMATLLVVIAVALSHRPDAGLLGLALLNMMDLGDYLSWFIQAWTLYDTSLGAMARIKDFTRRMPQEEQGQLIPDKDWLSEGRFEFKNLTASYSPDSEPVLNNVNLTLKPGQKIAICGRTGSGKSSLASALFGLLHIKSGAVLADGYDITETSQQDLRSKLIALPQDPYFCPGTVRFNLALREPERSTVTDQQTLSALQAVGLRARFEDLATSSTSEAQWLSPLDVELNPADMLTKGQQQLFAMARTLLSSGQLLVLDEATSGLDAESDRLVQRLLRGKEFEGRTMVAVAHRLQTIMDFDTVVVMHAGRIVEMGNPRELSDKEGGYFAGLVRSGGT